ncbi:MAG: hypothetical protein HYU29_06940 [Chloroflexi bacterium]|nr:hypothetical protein [Chloroflexota bacterium]MBI2851259.1 hypothetical protein [Chloroflexota bacterium]
MPEDAKTIEELIGVLVQLIPAGINGMIERIVAAHPEFVDPTIEMVEGTPQPIYKAKFGNIAVITIQEFLSFAFDRPDLSHFFVEQTNE